MMINDESLKTTATVLQVLWRSMHSLPVLQLALWLRDSLGTNKAMGQVQGWKRL